MTPQERRIADEFLAHNLDLLRLTASEQKRVLKVLQKLEKELVKKLREGDSLSEYSRNRLNALLNDTRAIVASHYTQIEGGAGSVLNALPGIEVDYVQMVLAQTVDVGLGAALPTTSHFASIVSDVLIQGAPSSEWWSRQEKDMAFRFANEVRMGVAQGQTNAQIISRVRQTMDVSRRNAAALVQTSVQTVANDARLQAFKENSDVIKGLRQLSTLDGHTTEICIAYSGAEWDLEGNPIGDTDLPFNGGPPRHWNCRSVLVPITKTFKELGLDLPEAEEGKRASADGPISSKITFEDFLERKGKGFQDEVLGKGRAELWRDGKITLQQLLDLKGRPLTLEQLRAKYDK